jgi:DNA-binding transcriptional LysR family regulator
MHNCSHFLSAFDISDGMDLRRLRTFVAVAELGTVSKAALRLRISQPALSRQINELEQEFSLRLFDRVGRRLILTAVGEQVLEDCRSVLGQVGSLGDRVELLRRGASGVLRVAAPPQTIESVLSGFLPHYTAGFPNVHVKLTEALGHEQLPLLERGEVHLGIRHDQGTHPRLASRSLQPDEALAAWAPPLHLGGTRMIDIARLADHPLLLPDSGYSVRKMFDAACRLAEIEPKMLLESRAPHTLLALAEAGYGVAIIPSILTTRRYSLQIARIAYRNRPLRERLIIQWNGRRPIPSYAESFCEQLAEYMRALFPITQPSMTSTPAGRRRVAFGSANRA